MPDDPATTPPPAAGAARGPSGPDRPRAEGRGLTPEAPAAPPRRPRRQPTQVDLARHAGVSQATVSQVVNETPDRPARLTPETRQRVLDAIADLGYRANPAARSLKGKQNRLLGLYAFEPVFPVDQRDFYFPFLLGVEEEVARQGYDLILFSSAVAGARRPIFVEGVNRLRLADGAVLLGRHMSREDLAELVAEDFPFVFIGRRELGSTPLSYVGADYAAATRELVGRFAELGHRDIAFLRQPGDSEPTADRERGYHEGMAGVGEPITHEGAFTTADLRALLDAGVTALLAEPTEDDRIAADVEAAATELGVSIPEDLSVGLLGDPTWSQSANDWTRFAVPRPEMGRRAVRLLIELLENGHDTARQDLVACEYLAGETLSRPRRSGRS
ncbi:LacI family DNA-binding transcriptional regulator [Phytomonospora endophytica]|uniref:DNA-binding LacI/PurR family transcriptional regulator n=1 Tax=Phytomonospora endophytica TaxID=714109 RepID=A0A841FQ97_9ACTN|nr:LacI family DNA-binding transcriptional regulator [Phytomonospora endophytica]MBB6038014.1 DNA-binding LacI/PurR family transcriptional regulator [Phytomonospora endophytica]GIG68913.1 LacI family transcriptional regulator [Phytomonospora endophytica]